jgi:hypothetical protein
MRQEAECFVFGVMSNEVVFVMSTVCLLVSIESRGKCTALKKSSGGDRQGIDTDRGEVQTTAVRLE